MFTHISESSHDFTFAFAFLTIITVYGQWERVVTSNEGPLSRRGHTLTTWINGSQYLENNTTSVNDILIVFGGRSQYFHNCSWPDGWDNDTCGDHFYSALTDTTIVLSKWNDEHNGNCQLNCSNNGWCHYSEPIDDSYCICFDDYRGTNCEIREFQDIEYDIWLLNLNTLTWQKYNFVNRSSYSYANWWPWPSGRFGHTSVIDYNSNNLYLYGGYSGKCVDYCNDLWKLDLTNLINNDNSWIEIIKQNNRKEYNNKNYNISSGERWHHHSWIYNNSMYIYGGHRHKQFLNDIFKFNLINYTFLQLNNDINNDIIPPTRLGSAFTVGDTSNNIYIHGGYHSTNRIITNYTGIFPKQNSHWLRDLWNAEIVDNYNNSYNNYSNNSLLFNYSSIANDTTIGVLYSNISYADLLVNHPINDEILTELNRWYAIPFPRMNHRMIYLSKNMINNNNNTDNNNTNNFSPINSDFLLLFGGYISHQFMNDTWRFDIKNSKWHRHYPPKIWDLHTSSYYINHELFIDNMHNITSTYDNNIKNILNYLAANYLNKSNHIATNITTLFKFITQTYEIYAIDSNVTRINNSKYIIEPRSDFDISYVPSLNSIILFGGYGSDRSLFNYDLGYDTHHLYFNDTFIFKFNSCLGPTLYDTSDPCNSANNHGKCILQYCFCDTNNYWGNACQNKMCPNSTCVYNNDTWLPQCKFCNNKGICDKYGKCHCMKGYKGDSCQYLDCPNDCFNNQTHGTCVEKSYGNVECQCNSINTFQSYTGNDCSLIECPRNCFNRGQCNLKSGKCTCNTATEAGRKYKLPDCAITVLQSTNGATTLNKIYPTVFGFFTLYYLFIYLFI